VWQVYQPPASRVRLDVEPVLASWDGAQTRSQVRLAQFLGHAASAAAPMMAATSSLAIELAVGLPPEVPLTSSGRDIDNYLYPLVKRLGVTRFSAVFGRKFHGSSSWLAIGPAQVLATTAQPKLRCVWPARTSTRHGNRASTINFCSPGFARWSLAP